MGYSFRLAARVLLCAPSHRQDSTYHSLWYTSGGALAGRSLLTYEDNVWPERAGPGYLLRVFGLNLRLVVGLGGRWVRPAGFRHVRLLCVRRARQPGFQSVLVYFLIVITQTSQLREFLVGFVSCNINITQRWKLGMFGSFSDTCWYLSWPVQHSLTWKEGRKCFI